MSQDKNKHHQFHVRLDAVNTGGFHWRRAGSIFRAPLTLSFSMRFLCSSAACSVKTMTQLLFCLELAV